MGNDLLTLAAATARDQRAMRAEGHRLRAENDYLRGEIGRLRAPVHPDSVALIRDHAAAAESGMATTMLRALLAAHDALAHEDATLRAQRDHARACHDLAMNAFAGFALMHGQAWPDWPKIRAEHADAWIADECRIDRGSP